MNVRPSAVSQALQTIVAIVAGDMDNQTVSRILEKMTGERCLRACFSYGDEVRLHIGGPVPWSSPRLKDEERGAWVLGTRGTPWQLLREENPIVESSANVEREEEILRQTIEGARIKSVEAPLASERTIALQVTVALMSDILGTPRRAESALTISFDNGYRFCINPGPDDDAGDLSYWELLTPDHMLLRFGPRRLWSCVPSNVPTRPQTDPIPT
jgi:hypothetical protein